MHCRPLARAATAALLTLAFLGRAAAALPVPEARVRQAVTQDIVELADFYERLRKLAATDPILKRIGFTPDRDVALAGGLGREIAWRLYDSPRRKFTRLADVHSPDRDIDLVYLGNADGDDEGYVLGLIRDLLQETLTHHGANVLRVDAHSLREKEESNQLAVLGYDTVSQGLVTPSALLDMAVLLKMAPADESTAALLEPSLVYHLPQGVRETEVQFLHQLVQVVRVCKIAAEFPNAPLTDETRASLRAVLGAYRERQKALEAYLKAAGERGDHYFRNRLGDVYTALLRFQGGGALYKELDAEYGISKFAPLRALVVNAAVTRRTVPLLGTGTPREADVRRILLPGDRYPMGDGFFFDPTEKQIFYGNAPVLLAFRTNGAAIEAQAFSPQRGPVAPELLPIDRWEMLRVRRFQGKLWAVIARNRRSDHHVIGILDTSKGALAEILFMNRRSFSPESVDGNYIGKRGPMISMYDVTAVGDSLVAFAATRSFSEMKIDSNSFKLTPYPARVPVRTRIASFEIEGGIVFCLAVDGHLYALRSEGNAELLMEHVVGIARGVQGLLAYVEEQPSKTPALYVFESGATGYRRLPFPMPTADAMPRGIAGQDGASVLRRRFGDVPLLAPETPGLAYLRRPEAELLAAAKALGPSLPPGDQLHDLFGQVIAATQRPETLTDDNTVGRERIGILTRFKDLVLRTRDDAETRAVLGEIYLLRSLLELRRGRTPVFGFSPNTYVLARLFELTAEFASPRTLPVLSELAQGETIDELVFREPTTGSAKNGQLESKAIHFVKQSAATLFNATCEHTLASGGT